MNENQKQKQWLVVKNDENKRKPYKATGLCFVTTTNRDEEYALHLYCLQHQNGAYLFPKHEGYFKDRINLSTLQRYSIIAFTEKYPNGITI